MQKDNRTFILSYFIFNNKQLDELVEKLPKSIDELMKISGFAEKKCEKYGEEIINIIKKYCI